jgi:UDP-glucose:(heptosyl)LPS alpha-1,3-glucosyltransferase
MEAMTAGLPVLVTDVCGYASHVLKADAGFVLKSPYNQVELNSALLTMINAPQAHWQLAGIEYTQNLLKQSSVSAEADLLIQFTHKKMAKA